MADRKGAIIRGNDSENKPDGLDRANPPRPRFIVDVMLGTLAKWLRILGYDTRYENRFHDDRIVELAAGEDRIVLTRDRRLILRRQLSQSILIGSDELASQIHQVLATLGEEVNPEGLLVRCLTCNTLLEELDWEEAGQRVPPYVHGTQSHFKQCPSCGRTYWGGTHRRHILERLREMDVI